MSQIQVQPLTPYQQAWFNLIIQLPWSYLVTFTYVLPNQPTERRLYKDLLKWSAFCQPVLHGRFDWFAAEEVSPGGFLHAHAVLYVGDEDEDVRARRLIGACFGRQHVKDVADFLQQAWGWKCGGVDVRFMSSHIKVEPARDVRSAVGYVLKDFRAERFMLMSRRVEQDLKGPRA